MKDLNQIKSLAIKGFSKEEIAKICKIEVSEIPEDIFNVDISQSSSQLYSELQKDLSKLVATELNKDNRDTNAIINAIKMQAELQEKKLAISRIRIDDTKIKKDYIYNRDEDIKKMFDEGISIKDIAKKFDMDELSIKSSLDRTSLNLSDELKSVSPSIISETKGLPVDIRLEIIKQAHTNNSTRKEIRSLCNEYKNKLREENPKGL